MIPFLISVLWFLLYAALAYFLVWFIIWAYEQLFAKTVGPRPRQIIFAVVAILMVIWFLSSLATKQPILPPWHWFN